MKKQTLRSIVASLLVVTFLTPIETAFAVVSATGTNASICDQNVGDPVNISAYRLSGGDCVIEFKKVGTTTWSIPAGVTSAWVLVIGGGGGGASRHGGGGGAGGFVEATSYSISGTIGITVGGGGSGGASAIYGTSGADSRFYSYSETTAGTTGLIAKGGGYGDFYTQIDTHNIGRAGSGGSGGGSGVSSPFTRDLTTPYGNTASEGLTIQSSQTQRQINGTTLSANFSQYGNNGAGGGDNLYWAGGGGGGASTAGSRGGGSAGTNYQGGDGGAGRSSSITSTATTYAGGGGGGGGLYYDGATYFTKPAGAGGTGGGGAGSVGTLTATSGTANTGGGGGGGGLASNGNGPGGAGGSGIIIVRYTPDTTAPTFTVSSPYSFAENTSAATNVATIRTSESSTIAFGVGGDQASFDLIFGDSTTAYLRFKSPPNYESPTDAGSNNGYDINLTATDPSGNVGSSSIVVNVTNVNEAPTITTNSSNATHLISQGENSTSVLTYTGSDIDANSTLSWSISGTDSGRFSIGTSTGVLTFLASPDFESASDFNQDNDYLLTITLSDGALTDTQTLTVRVTNVNEAPTIGSFSSAGAASYSVIEGTTSLFNLNGSDLDANSTLTYSISGTDSSFFTVSGSGVLSFASARNFENPQDFGGDNSYVVIAQVSDGTLIDTQTITVSITNLNEAPLISTNGSNSTYAISLSEGTSAVVTYTGSDVDAGSVLTWSISGTDSVLFTINANTGALSFLSAPDFEAPADSSHNNIYIVIITLSDGTLTDTQTLTITITNVNEAGSITAPSISGTAYKGVAITLNITTNTPGKVRFLVGGIRITNCLARATTGSYPNYLATCSWKPANIGSQKVTAVITPSDSTFSSATSAPASIWVYRRTTKR